MSSYQDNQKKVVDELEKQVESNALSFSTVTPVTDYINDPRMCLTSVHFPHAPLIDQIQQQIIEPLQKIEHDHFYYPRDSFHITIKNIRIINDPPHFTDETIKKSKQVFTEVIPKHKKLNVSYYRLLLFPNSLALIGTTDPEMDALHLELDRELTKAGIPDDKKYMNNKYFFSNMTLVRFYHPATEAYKKKIKELSGALSFLPYTIDSVTLLSSTAVFTNRRVYGTWELK